MPQLLVGYEMDKGYEGMKASTNVYAIRSAVNEFRNKLPKTAANPLGLLPFGRGVIADPSDSSGILLPTAAGDVIIGISFATEQKEQVLLTSSDPKQLQGYETGEQVGVATFGDYWVVSETLVRRGDPAFCRITPPASGVLQGRWGNAAGADFVAFPKARFARDMPAGLVIITLGEA